MSERLFEDTPSSPSTRSTAKADFAQKLRERKLRELHPIPENWRPSAPPELRGEKRIILNAETKGVKWWDGDLPIGWSYYLPESDRSGYLPIRHSVGENLDVSAVHSWLRTELLGVHLDNANTKFDLHTSKHDGVDLRDICASFGDVQHEAALLDDHRFRFNLDQLYEDEFGIEIEDKIPAGIEHEGQFHELPAATVAPYAVRNVLQVARLQAAYAPRLAAEGLGEVLQLEREVLPTVVEMEENGTYLNLEQLERWHRDVKVRLDEIRFRIFKGTGQHLDSFNSSKQLETLFRSRGIPIESFTDGGAPSFTDNALKGPAQSDEFIALAREGRQLVDLNGDYLAKYLKAARSDGWLRFNLHQLRNGKDENNKRGAVSGRFSAAGDEHGGYNPQQVVAVEKQIERGWCPDYVLRKLFIPAPYETMLGASDMMQVEYRIFADYVDDPAINAAYAADPHADYHKVVMGLLHRINPNLNRKLVKNVNFAKIYGAGLIKFAFMIGEITEKVFKELSARLMRKDWSVFDEPALAKAKAINDAYNDMFPGVRPLLKQCSKVAEDRGYVFTLLGRRARLLDRFYSALNRVVQGGAADVNKRSLVELAKVAKSLGIFLHLTVHDEVVFGLTGRTAQDREAQLQAVDKQLNTQYFSLRVPIFWDTKMSETWAGCK